MRRSVETAGWVLAVALLAAGCGDIQYTFQGNTGATISAISPSDAVAGGSSFTLTVFGVGFTSNTVVRWNGQNLPSAIVSSGPQAGLAVTATVPQKDIATAGTVLVDTLTPQTGAGNNGLSNTLVFTIWNTPNIASLSPPSQPAGGGGFPLTITGGSPSNFVPPTGSDPSSGSLVQWNGPTGAQTLMPTSVTSTQIVVTVPASAIQCPGTATVNVSNPGPFGATSATGLPFTITGDGGCLNMTMMDTAPPDTAAPSFSVLSFQATITGISLTPQSGSSVDLNLPSSPVVELTRLQSDSAFLGTFLASAGTYTGMSLTLANPDVVIYSPDCPNGLVVCEFMPGGTTVIPITFPSNVVVPSPTPPALALEFNLANILTFSGGTASVNFTSANVTTVNLPRTGSQAAGVQDLIEDFTGVVTAVDPIGGTVTIQSGTRGTMTATANSGTTYNDPQNLCGGIGFTLACLTGKTKLAIVSADAALNSNGSLTLLELDLLNLPSTSQDEVEGVVYQLNGSNQFSMVLADKYVEDTNASLTGAAAGNLVNVTVNSGATFSADPKNLPVPTSPKGFTAASDVVNGQTVMVHAVSASTGNGGVISLATDRVTLRYTRVTGLVSPIGNPTFTLSNLPAPLFPTNFTAPVDTFPVVTAFDNILNISGLNTGATVSIRALFLNSATASSSPFLAAKVRKQQ